MVDGVENCFWDKHSYIYENETSDSRKDKTILNFTPFFEYDPIYLN